MCFTSVGMSLTFFLLTACHTHAALIYMLSAFTAFYVVYGSHRQPGLRHYYADCDSNLCCHAGIGDLERALARLHAAGLGGGMGRDAMQVVLYEDNAKRR